MNREEVLRLLWQALKQVPYPGYSRDIVSFGMVKGVDWQDNGSASVNLWYSTEPESLRDKIRESVITKLKDVPGVKEAKVTLEPRPRQVGEVPVPKAVPGVKNVIAVASGKGGVGKSTVAVNLAFALKEVGRHVGILDADIYGPSMTIMLKTGSEPTAHGHRIVPVDAYGLRMISMAFFLSEEDQALVWRGPMVMKAVHQLVWDVEWGELDDLVVDLPPGTGDAQLTLLQEVQLRGAVIVTTPQRVALIDARKGVTMFRKLNTPIFGIVENMSYFRCPRCGTEYDLFARGGGREAARTLGVPFLGEIPIEPEMRAGADRGEPVLVCAPESEAAKAFRSIAEQIVTFMEKGQQI